MNLFSKHIEEVAPEAIAFRRELHAHPELSFQERETAGRIRARLAQIPNIKVLPPTSRPTWWPVLNADKPGQLPAAAGRHRRAAHEEATGVPYARRARA